VKDDATFVTNRWEPSLVLLAQDRSAEVSHAQNCIAIDVVLECYGGDGTGRYRGSDYPAYICSVNQCSADACSSGHYPANGCSYSQYPAHGCAGYQQAARRQQAIP
jgi:hypothetical protein